MASYLIAPSNGTNRYSSRFIEPSQGEASWSSEALKSIALTGVFLTASAIFGRRAYRQLDSSVRFQFLSEGDRNNIDLASDLLKGEGLLTQKNLASLLKNKEYSGSVLKGLYHLNGMNILTQENFSALLENPKHAAEIGRALAYMQGQGVATEENCKVLVHVFDAENVLCVAKDLCKLHKLGLLTCDNRAVLLNRAWSHDISEIVRGLILLHKAEMLTPENRIQVSYSLVDSVLTAKSLICLKMHGMLEENRDKLLVGHWEINCYTARMILFLHREDLLNQENLTKIFENRRNVKRIFNCLDKLKAKDLLTQENFSALLNYAKYAGKIDAVLSYLDDKDILIQENFSKLLENGEDINDIWHVMFALDQTGSLSQESFSLLLENRDHVGRFREAINRVFIMGRLNRNELIAFCEDPQNAVQIAERLREEGRVLLGGRRRFEVDLSKIEEDCIKYLLDYRKELKRHLPRIRYKDSEREDAGGLTRDFITKLFKALSKDPRVLGREPFENDERVFLRCIRDREDKKTQIRAFKAIGVLFAHAYKNNRFTTGQRFSPAMFKIIHALLNTEKPLYHHSEITDVDSDQYKRLFQIFLRNEYPELLKNQEEEEKGFDLSDLQVGFNEVLLASTVVAQTMKKELLSIGMKKEEIKGITVKGLSVGVQGAISAEKVISALRYPNGEWEQSKGLEAWIRGLSKKDLEKFVWTATGSETLHPEVEIEVRVINGIEEGSLPAYHTCSRELHIPRYPNAETLAKKFQQSIENLDKGFQFV